VSRNTISIREPIVITGIGALASIGADRESLWQAVQRGESGVRRLHGVPGIPDGEMIGATVEIPNANRRLKQILLAHQAAAEALSDARIDFDTIEVTHMSEYDLG